MKPLARRQVVACKLVAKSYGVWSSMREGYAAGSWRVKTDYRIVVGGAQPGVTALRENRDFPPSYLLLNGKRAFSIRCDFEIRFS